METLSITKVMRHILPNTDHVLEIRHYIGSPDAHSFVVQIYGGDADLSISDSDPRNEMRAIITLLEIAWQEIDKTLKG